MKGACVGPTLPFLQGSEVNKTLFSGCLFSVHHYTCHGFFVSPPTPLADESTPLELFYGSLCLLHTYLNLPFLFPLTHTQAHTHFSTGMTSSISLNGMCTQCLAASSGVWILDLLKKSRS